VFGGAVDPTPTPPPAPTPTVPPSPTPTVPPSPTPTVPPTATPTSTPTPQPSATPTAQPSATPVLPPVETTVVLQQGTGGYTGSRDAYISQSSRSDNYSTAAGLRVGSRQRYASLVQYDLRGIPANAVVTQALVQFYATAHNGAPVSVGAYAVVRDIEPAQATWNRAKIGAAWTVAGCKGVGSDRRGNAESSVVVNAGRQWYTMNVTAAVQDWLEGSLANEGLALQADDSAGVVTFASGDYSSAKARPKLIVTYRVAS